jgi:hypothetical protein
VLPYSPGSGTKSSTDSGCYIILTSLNYQSTPKRIRPTIMAPKKMIMPKSLPNKNDMYSPIELNSKKNPLNSLKNLII